MVLIKLKVKGGLGNQLSQISFAYKILKQYKDSSLIIDKSLYKKPIKRDLKIGKYIHKTNTFKFFLDELPVSKIYSYKNKISILDNAVFFIHDLIFAILKGVQIFFKIFGISRSQKILFLILAKVGILTDDNRAYLDFPKSFIPIITISGYFQDIKYHEHNKEILREFFLKKPNETKDIFSSELNPCLPNSSFLLRLNFDRMIDFNTEYYLNKSFKILSQIKGYYNFIFFSDDQQKLKKTKKQFKSPIYCNEKDPLTQLYFAANAKVYIISASSFAWWSYFLSNYEEKVVIKPNRWVLDDPNWSPGFSLKDIIYNIDLSYD